MTNPKNSELIGWTEDDNCFLVHQIDRFSKDLLPLFFRHSNYSSFLRQLNLYGFVKKRYHDDRKHLFTHPLFVRDQPHTHSLIKRRPVGTPEADKEEMEETREPLQVRVRNMKKRQERLMRQCS